MPHYDVFLSHNSKDKPAVETIGRLLREKYQLGSWLDKSDLVPGEGFVGELDQALEQCGTMAVFIGADGLGPWQSKEVNAALQLQAVDESRRIIPVLLPGAPAPQYLKLSPFLTEMTWVDFRAGLDDEDALHRLYCGVRGLKPGGDPEPEITVVRGGLPAGSYVPFPRNVLFTGREADLKTLADNLINKKGLNTVISQAVTGMGGLGKTQLAVEFAYRYGHRFKGVHWLDLRDPQALDGAIAICGNRMGYSLANQPDQVAATMKAWVEDGPRLLILDNFEEVAQANEVLARFQSPSLRLLVTSRRSDFHRSTGLQVQPLGVFSEEESAQFLEKTLEQPESLEARRKLAAQLGCLPLALELAASYLNITHIGIEGYLQELENISQLDAEHLRKFQSMDIATPTEHDQSLFGTFQLSWREVQDETQQRVFMLAGYLAPNTPIPLEIFKETLQLEEKDLSSALYRLNALGLLPVANRQPSIHPLLAAYARTLSSKELLEQLADKLARLARQANDQVDQTGSLGWFVPLRPHVLAAAGYAEAAGIPDAGNLLGNLGYYLRTIADYQGAKDAFERALKVDEIAHGLDDPEVATDLNNLGKVLHDLGDLKSAEASYRRALKIVEASYDPDHPDVGLYASNLGLVLQDLGNLADAETNFRRALNIAEISYGPNDPNVAIEILNLGLVLQAQGDLAGARDKYERALMIDEAAYGPEHPDVAKDVRNLGLVLQAQGDLAGAKENLERALQINRAVYDSEHPKVARDINNLGLLLQAQGDLAGATDNYKQALRIYKKFLPEGHPDIRIVQGNLDSLSGQK